MYHPLVDRHNWEVLLLIPSSRWGMVSLPCFSMNCILHMPADHVLNLFCTSENRLSPQTMQLME